MMRIVRSAVLCAVLAAAACASEGAPEVSAELSRLEQETNDGLLMVERALADPEFRSLGDGVRKVESSIRSLDVLEADPATSDAQRFQAMILSARAWDLLAGSFEAAAETTAVSTLRDKATPARFLATSGYARAYEFACRHGLTDHPLFIENAAVCPE
jgi:outer membrane lipoprotein-sorting protein